MLRLLLAVGLVFTLLNTDLMAQYPKIGLPPVTQFSRQDYRAGTQNWQIRQQANGLVYVANNKGLLEFDGNHWNLYRMPNRSVVRSVTIADDGKIYVGGQQEAGYMEADEAGMLQYHSINELIPEGFRSYDDVWKIFVLNNGVYFCSERAIFLYQNGIISVISPENRRFNYFFLFNDQIWIQSDGLYRLDGQRPVPVVGGDLFDKKRIVALLPHPDYDQLVLTANDGFFAKTTDGFRRVDFPANDFVKKHQAFTAVTLKNGNMAIGSIQNGLLVTDQDGHSVLHLTENNGLQNNTILSVLEDDRSQLWLGLDNGIDYVQINLPFWKIQNEAGMTGTGYTVLHHDEQLYFGTNQGLYATDWPLDDDAQEKNNFVQVPGSIGQIWSLTSLGNELVVGQHNGVSVLDKTRLHPLSDILGAWKIMPLKRHPGVVLEGSYDGFYLYHLKSGQPVSNWKLIGKIQGFDESARVFEEDERGAIWVSHAYKGLYKLQLDPENLTDAKVTFYDKAKGLPDDLLVNVTKVRGELLFTTLHGVYRYDQAADRVVPDTAYNEIFGADSEIHRMLEDEGGNIWFSVNQQFGVIKIRDKGLFNDFDIQYFNQYQDELVDGFECVYALDKNNVFIGTEKGFLHFQPPANERTRKPLRLLLRKVEQIGRRDSVVFHGQKQEGERPLYDFVHNNLRFSYAAPFFEKPKYVRYKYRLDGFEEEWSDWTYQTEKEYTNLPSGEYTFNVLAGNATGQESDVVRFAFEIGTPWYRTLISKLSYLLLGGFLLTFFYRRIYQEERQKTEAFKQVQTEKLEQKEAEFKREVEKTEGEISQLKTEKLNQDIKHKNAQLASATMHLVQKSEILMKIKKDLNAIQPDLPAAARKKVRQISRTIEADIHLDDSWDQFENYFDQVHENFFKRLRRKFPELTPKDQKLCAYLRMNLTTKEIAPLLNISVRGVEISRYRLRKKLGIASEVNLVAFMMEV